MNQPFVDGDRRAAFALTVVFLRMNGLRLVASADDAERFVIEELLGAHATLDQISAWLTRHARRA